jgi:hypothetical protein
LINFTSHSIPSIAEEFASNDLATDELAADERVADELACSFLK